MFDALEPLGDDDFQRAVIIRGESFTVLQAINRQLTHYAYHVGQVVQLVTDGIVVDAMTVIAVLLVDRARRLTPELAYSPWQ